MSGPWTLVTGGAGFIGSHVVDALLACSRRVIVIDRDLESPRAQVNLGGSSDGEQPGDLALQRIVADIARPLRGPIERALGPLASLEIDAVIHLAAQVAVARSLDAPIADAVDNLIGTLEVAALARELGARLIFASSAAVYGISETLPVAEENAGWPPSPYGIHKLAAEMHLRVQAQLPERPLDALSLRFFNVYGPRQDPQSPYAGVIVRFIERALRGQPLEIFGDGQQTRDFIYVADVVAAILAACERGPRDGTPINIGSGRELTIRELAEQIVTITGSTSPIVHLPARDGEVRRSQAAVERAAIHLGERAQIPLDDGLREVAAWIRGGLL